MSPRPAGFFALALWACLGLAGPAWAMKAPALARVSDAAPPTARAVLLAERAGLEKQWRALSHRARDHNNRCSQVPAGGPKARWRRDNVAALGKAANRHVAKVLAFNRRVEQALWQALNRPNQAQAEEERLGRALALARETERKNRILRDPAVDRYLAGVLARLEKASPGSRFSCRAKVMDKGAINAFVLPGGHIYVHRALLSFAVDESELAGVLAHEMAHVTAGRHGAELLKIAKAIATGVVGGAAGGPIGGFGLLTQRRLQNLAYLKFTRDQEREADRLAVEMLYRTGLSPAGLVSFFSRLGKTKTKNAATPNRYQDFISTHPTENERVAAIAPLLADPRFKRAHPRDGKDFKKIKGRLSRP